MPKEKGKVKNTAVGISDKDYEWIPKVSFGPFRLDDSIKNYLEREHIVSLDDDPEIGVDIYNFLEIDVEVLVERKDNRIMSVRCDNKCFWKNINLIGIDFDKLIELIGYPPDETDKIYIPVSNNRGQNQHVYEFYNLDLQVWVWRKKVVTIFVSNDDE